MKKFLAFFLIIFSIQLLAQVESSRRTQKNKGFPGFNVDIASYKGTEEGKTRVDLFVQVPYENLQFIKVKEGYSAKYSIHVKFSEKNSDKIIVESLWNEKVLTESFEESRSKSNYNFSLRSFNVPHGEYALRCEVVDRDSKKSFIVEATANILDVSDPLDISDLLFISSIIRDGDSEKIIPNISRKVTTDDQSLAFYFEVYSDSKQDIKLEYDIINKAGDNVYVELIEREVLPGNNRIIYEIDDTEFKLGEHSLQIKLRTFEFEDVATVRKKFISKIAGFPETIIDIELAVEQLLYIATQDEIDYIKSAKDEESKINRFKEYWKSKDPSPRTTENEVFNEYYRRIDYANQRFGNYFKGWKSDMGMVYITLGPPSAVERHPFDMGQKPYEIWEYYHINRSFVFIDNSGFGDYRLTALPYGDQFRFRR